MNKVSITMYSSDLRSSRIENEECLKKLLEKEELEKGTVLMLSTYSLHSI